MCNKIRLLPNEIEIVEKLFLRIKPTLGQQQMSRVPEDHDGWRAGPRGEVSYRLRLRNDQGNTVDCFNYGTDEKA